MVLAALALLGETYPVQHQGRHWQFRLPGYTIEFYLRSSETLVVTFDPRRKSYPPSDSREAWAAVFLARRGLSGLHVKPDQSCWYLDPGLEAFFRAAQAAGLFGSFATVMNYGGSMGGFGALAFAAITGAQRVMAMNPQANLGPAVRGWERRYKEAEALDWARPICDLPRQVAGVETLAVVYDPYDTYDRPQADLIAADHMIRLHIPFVGHRMPAHLLYLRLLAPVFDQTLAGALDLPAFYRAARQRRMLRRYKRVMLRRTKDNKPRHRLLKRLLPEDDVLIGEA